jgi:hypothetical protein
MVRQITKIGLILVAITALGMSGLTGEIDPREFPKPVVNYVATVTDRSELTLEVEQLSFDGEVFLKGEMGVSQIAISFDRIKSIDFSPTEDGKRVIARADLGEEEIVEVYISRNLDIFGKASFGIYQVLAKNLKKIEIKGRK